MNKAIHNEGFKLMAEVQQSIAGRKSEPTSVDTGAFLGSVPRGSGVGVLIARVGSDIKYAKHLEYGTSKISPRRHFRNSLNRRRRPAKQAIINAVKQAIKI